MKASEAKALSESVSSTGLKEAMKAVEAKIHQAIWGNCRSVNIYSTITGPYRRAVVAELKSLGYSVDEGYDPRENYSWITISW